MHDLAPGRSASAVGRRCGCARARYAAVQSSVAQLTAACAGPALGGGPARRQPDQTQAADSMALTWRRTVKDSGTRPRLSPMFCAGAEHSLTVQPPWNGQSVTIPVSGVAGLSGSPQLLSRYRRCSRKSLTMRGLSAIKPAKVAPILERNHLAFDMFAGQHHVNRPGFSSYVDRKEARIRGTSLGSGSASVSIPAAQPWFRSGSPSTLRNWRLS